MWAKLPTNSITVTQYAVIDDDEEWNGGDENNGDAAGEWQVCLCMLGLCGSEVFSDAFFSCDVISPK